MIEIAKDLYLLRGFPDYAINVYLAGDVLIDAGTRIAQRRLIKQLRGRSVKAHALTHVHPDHQGSSHAICQELNIPLWVGQVEAPAMESGNMDDLIPRNFMSGLVESMWRGPKHPVARALQEGDIVGGFTVIDAPGHSPGHIVYWRESDRVLIVGDVMTNMNLLTMQPGLYEPPAVFTLNQKQNRESLRKLAELNPKIVCFGHGKPLMDGQKMVDFVTKNFT